MGVQVLKGNAGPQMGQLGPNVGQDEVKPFDPRREGPLSACMYVTKIDCQISKSLALRFFILCTTKEGINTDQIVKTAFRLMYLVLVFF